MSDSSEAFEQQPQPPAGARVLNETSRSYYYGDVTIVGPVAFSETADGVHVVTDMTGAIYIARDWKVMKIVPRRA